MKRTVFVGLIFCVANLAVADGRVGVLKEVFKPDRFLVARDYVYIGEKTRVTVYARQGLNLVRQFGRAGEGPQEFKLGHGVNSLGIDVVNHQLVIGSLGKMSVFSLEGVFIREFKVPAFDRLLPVPGGYVASTSLPVEEGFPVQAVVRLDEKLNRREVLLKTDNPLGMGARFQVPRTRALFRVSGGRIYVADDSETLSVKVFDLAGNPVSVMEGPEERVAVPREFKKRLETFYRTSPDWKDYWDYVRQHLTFPDYFPAVRDFFVDRGRVYVQSFVYRAGRAQWLVFDPDGNLTGRAWLPLDDYYTDEPTLHGVRDGLYYTLRDNPDQEVWEMQTVPIKPSR